MYHFLALIPIDWWSCRYRKILTCSPSKWFIKLSNPKMHFSNEYEAKCSNLFVFSWIRNAAANVLCIYAILMRYANFRATSSNCNFFNILVMMYMCTSKHFQKASWYICKKAGKLSSVILFEFFPKPFEFLLFRAFFQISHQKRFDVCSARHFIFKYTVISSRCFRKTSNEFLF